MITPSRSLSLALGQRLLRGRSAIPLRAGGGVPTGSPPPITRPLPENDELVWDDGTPVPEFCLDIIAPQYSKGEGFAMLAAGLGFYALLYQGAKWNDKASKMPYAPREYPFDNLRAELGYKTES